MTLMRRALNAITRAPTMPGRIPMTPAMGQFAMGAGLGSINRTTQLQSYDQVSWLFATISRIAQSVAGVEWRLTTTSGTEIKQHDALTLWDDINPFDTRQEFLELTQQHLDLTGEAWWLVLRQQGVPKELWVLRPDRMRPIPHRTEFVAGYVYTIGAERIPLTRDEVIFIRMPSPLDPYRGVGPVSSLLVDIGVESMAAQWARNFYRNSAEPGGIIELEDTMSDAEFERFRAQWSEQHQGVSQAHRVAILERGHWVDRKYTQRDQQFEQLRRLNRDLILGAFGMPLPILGIVESVNRANAEAADAMFSRWIVKPRLDRIRATLNARLLPMFRESDLLFEYDNPVPDDRALDLAESTQGYKAGLLTLNEARILLNQEPMDEGNELYTPPTPMLIPDMEDEDDAQDEAKGRIRLHADRKDNRLVNGVDMEDNDGARDRTGVDASIGDGTHHPVSDIEQHAAPAAGAHSLTVPKEKVNQMAVSHSEIGVTEVENTSKQIETDGIPLNYSILEKSADPIDMAEAQIRSGWARRLRTEAEALGEYLGQHLTLETRQAPSAADGYDWNWEAKHGTVVRAELAQAFIATVQRELPGMPMIEQQRLAVEYALERGSRLLSVDGDLNVVTFTRTRVNELVAGTIERGESLGQLQKALREDVAFGRARARTVARTETATAQGHGSVVVGVRECRSE